MSEYFKYQLDNSFPLTVQTADNISNAVVDPDRRLAIRANLLKHIGEIQLFYMMELPDTVGHLALPISKMFSGDLAEFEITHEFVRYSNTTKQGLPIFKPKEK